MRNLLYKSYISLLIFNIGFAMMTCAQPMHSPISLPEPVFRGPVSVEQALVGRRSIRSYTKEPLEISEISQILWAAYGITQKREDGPDFLRGGLRTAPSAGARYPLELYLVAGNVKGIDPGVYKYNSKKHQLILHINGDKRSELCEAALGQKQIQTAAAIIVYSAVFERTMSKYRERGKNRYVCMDLGHSAQNIYLQAFALHIGTCAMGAFNDMDVKSVINIPEDEEPLYLMPLGKLKSD